MAILFLLDGLFFYWVAYFFCWRDSWRSLASKAHPHFERAGCSLRRSRRWICGSRAKSSAEALDGGALPKNADSEIRMDDEKQWILHGYHHIGVRIFETTFVLGSPLYFSRFLEL